MKSKKKKSNKILSLCYSGKLIKPINTKRLREENQLLT